MSLFQDFYFRHPSTAFVSGSLCLLLQFSFACCIRDLERSYSTSFGLPLGSHYFVCRLLDRDTSPSVPPRKEKFDSRVSSGYRRPNPSLEEDPALYDRPHRMSYIPPAIVGRYTHHMDGDIATLLEGNRAWQCRIRTSFPKQDVRVLRKETTVPWVVSLS